jgi:hypothetical protein
MEPKKGYTYEKCGVQLIRICWTYVLHMWDIRNKEKHGENNKEQQHKHKQDMIAELRMIQHDNRELP